MKTPIDGFWAKLKHNEEDKLIAWHPLSAHSADVAATLEALLERTILGRRLGRLIGQEELDAPQIARLAFFAALHDVGKVNHGFQRRALSPNAQRIGHVSPLINFLDNYSDTKLDIVEALNPQGFAAWFAGDPEESVIQMLLTTWGHHGRPVIAKPAFREDLWRAQNNRDPINGIADLRQAAESWFPEAFHPARPFPDAPEFFHAFNGVLTLADWLGSDEEIFFWREDEQNRIDFARKQARVALTKMGLDPAPAREKLGNTPPDFDAVSAFKPYPIQAQAAALPINPGGSLSVLESDTGSGKTEAAIARFLKLFHAGEVDGMYFALPTRSAATQLYRRVVEVLGRAFPDPVTRPPAVLAVPGYLQVDGEEAVARLAHFKVLWPDHDRQRWRGWASEHPKRYMAGAVAVGTIDQALLSTLRVNHAHMRSAALLRHFLVIDEVHASDTYMTRLLESVLEHHLSAGGHAFLMSATLGSIARNRFIDSPATPPPSLDQALNTPYPLLTHKDNSDGEAPQIHAKSSDYSKTVDMIAAPIAQHPERVAQRAWEAAQQGARVLIIRNLVADCIATQAALEALAAEHNAPELLFGVGQTPAPHHSRFAAQDRRALDQAIEAHFGKNSPARPMIAVATQTVEQSLDIDADLLLTDISPVDVLLQRIGRLHRHPERARPAGFQRARVVALLPDELDFSTFIQPGGHTRGPCGIGTVYEHPGILQATQRLLESHPTWTIPRMNRLLVESATHPSALQKIYDNSPSKWKPSGVYIDGTRFADQSHADLTLINRHKGFCDPNNMFNEVDHRVQTRLGEANRRVLFDQAYPGPFAHTISELKLPAHMLAHIPEDNLEDAEEATNIRADDCTIHFEYAGRAFIYDRLGIRPAD